jgi:predicted DNA-binding transcriptional regulator AlpA
MIMERYLNIREAAVLTGFAVGTLRKYILRRTVPFHKKNGAIRFLASELKVWMAEEANRAGGGTKKSAGLQPELPMGDGV